MSLNAKITKSIFGRPEILSKTPSEFFKNHIKLRKLETLASSATLVSSSSSASNITPTQIQRCCKTDSVRKFSNYFSNVKRWSLELEKK